MDKNMNVTVALRGVDTLNPKVKQAIDRVNSLTDRAKLAASRLKDIAITQNQLRSIDNARGRMRDLGNQIKVAEAQMQATAAAMKIGTATQADMDKASRAVQRLKGDYQALARTAMDARSALNAKGYTGPLDAARTSLQAERAAALLQQQRVEAMQAARTRANVLQQRAGSAASAGASMLLPGYAITRGLGAATGEASAWQSELRQIAITADMSDARMQALGVTIMGLSDRVAQSTEALTGSAAFLIAAGMREDLAERSLGTIGRTATAYKAEILDISQAAFVMNDALGILPERLQGAMAIAARSGKEGNVELRDMAKVLPVLSGSLVALKLQGNEAVATIGAALQIARKGAPSADIAANNLQNFLAKVMSPETLKKAQKEFGLDLYKVVTQAQVNGKNPLEAALEAIGKATKGGDQKLLGYMFQDMQVQAFLRPMLQNMDEYRRIKALALGEAGGGMIDADFNRVAADMDISLRRIGTAWDNLKTKVGQALEPALKPIADMLGRATTALVGFAERNPKVMTFLAVLAGVFGVLLVVGGSVALMLGAILVPMAALTLLAGALGIGLLPLTLIILGIGAAIAAVVAGFVWFREEMATAWRVFKETWMAIGTWWQQFSFLDLGRAMARGLANGIKAGASWIWEAATGLATKAVDAIRQKLGIRSPSRVFAELGAFTAAGMAMGMAQGAPAVVSTAGDMARQVAAAGSPSRFVAELGAFTAAGRAMGLAQGAPAVVSTAGDMARQMAATGSPSLSSGTAAGGRSGGMAFGPVTIVIQGAADPQATAAAVEAKLRALDRQARTTAQSRFFED